MTSFAPGLYVVATPIGNLGDLSPRAAQVLAAASVVAAEDTRTSGRLVRSTGSTARLTSLTEHNVERRTPGLLAEAGSAVVALISDAGTPVVADPGARLVDAALEAGIKVVAIPGPSALAAAVSVAGFAGDDFHFLGFLERAPGERLARLRDAAATASVLVFFESPNRLQSALNDVATALDNPRVAVCRELTKVHEEVVRGRAADLGERFAETRGECTVVVEVGPGPSGAEVELTAYMGEMRRAGARRSAAAVEAAKRFGVNKETAYGLWERD